MSKTKPDKSALILTATILASGLGFFMGSAVNVVLPTIQGYWDLDLSLVQWIANSYALTLSAFILVSGSLGDFFGVRRVFNIGILVFTVAGALCGFAPTPGLLILGRAVQGLGAAFMVPGSLAIINRLYPEGERGRVIGLWAGVSGAIAALGPFLGGILADLSWRWVFWMIVPIGVAASVVTTLAVPKLRNEGEKGVDFAGAAAVLLALGGLSFGLIRIPEVGLTWLTGSGLALAALSGVVFFPIERRAGHPIVPFGMFNRTVAVANVSTLLLYFSFQGAFFLLSFVFQQLLGYSASFTGLAFLPTTAMIALLSAPSGSVTDRRGPRLQLVLGPAIVAVGLFVMAFGIRQPGYLSFWLPATLVFGAGMVFLIPAITKAALTVPEHFSGAASGLNNAAARTAGLLAITILGALLSATYQLLLPGALPADLSEAAREAVLADAGKLLAAELPSAVPEGLRSAVEEARRDAFAAGGRVAIGVSAILASLAALLALLRFPKAGSAGAR
ncbi:MAG: MFS transporter [Spirochaetaceae bacterium]